MENVFEALIHQKCLVCRLSEILFQIYSRKTSQAHLRINYAKKSFFSTQILTTNMCKLNIQICEKTYEIHMCKKRVFFEHFRVNVHVNPMG